MLNHARGHGDLAGMKIQVKVTAIIVKRANEKPDVDVFFGLYLLKSVFASKRQNTTKKIILNLIYGFAVTS